MLVDNSVLYIPIVYVYSAAVGQAGHKFDRTDTQTVKLCR